MVIQIDTTMLERTIEAADKQALLNELSYLGGISSAFNREVGVAFDAAKDEPAAFLRAYLARAHADLAGHLFDAVSAEIARRKDTTDDHHHR